MIKLTFAQRQQAESLINYCLEDAEVLDAFAAQHACGCGHPACRDCQRDAMAIAALRAGPEFAR